MNLRSALIVLAVVGILAAVFWPRSAEAIDVVNGVPPVATDLSSIKTTLGELAQLPPAERQSRLQKEWPRLETDVVHFLRDHGKLPQGATVEKVEFAFGSMKKVRAFDRTGNLHNGHFKDQLIARVYVKGRSETTDVAVQCLNGTFMTDDGVDAFASLQPMGVFHPVQNFTIRRGEGLVDHVPFRTAVSLARRHNLALFRGQRMLESNRITPEQALVMEPMTDRVQVTAQVYEGDYFDLRTGEFTRRGSSR